VKLNFFLKPFLIEFFIVKVGFFFEKSIVKPYFWEELKILTMKKLITLLLLCCFAFVQNGNSQIFPAVEEKQSIEDITIPNEVIVRLAENKHVNDILNRLPANYNLQVDRLLSSPTNIWLLNFDENAVSVDHIVRELNNLQDVLVSQPNTYVELREAPDDPLYGNQWQHQNINSEEAWDITTGGSSATGEDVVVCIIESANVIGHPDLVGNHWTNTAEVVDGTDTDGNGYIDDINGWNVATGNDDIGTGGHGTSVAGMIGAVGNNDLGVAGANWNVKMMVVAGYNQPFTQANIVEAYTYPLQARILWNNTDGAEGAFVVATNASWGVDQGDPNDYPIWCGFYDDLGAAGILNCGATTNQNLNVDVEGDVPTACASDYMVSVTATNIDDIIDFAGYGATTIDVGAPGSGIYTTNNSGYGTTSGTSFASPLTAGVIGLMYSIPCESFMTIVKNDPQGAADIVRQALFDGVDIIPELDGLVVTGGRINVKNAIDILMAEVCIVNDNDLGVIEINQPENGILTTAEEVEITISNFGFNTQSNFDVSYEVDSGTPVVETFAGSIASGETQTYTFTQTVDMSNVGQTYSITASTELTGDEDTSNDTTTKEVTHLEADDLGVIAITAPESGSDLTATETITVDITNFGGATQSDFEVSYTIDGGTPVTETVSGPLTTGETISYNFTQTGDFSALGDYEVTATTSLPGDVDPSNDSVTEIITKFSCQPTANCTDGDGLTKFILEEVNVNPITCTTNGYMDYTSEIATLDAEIGAYTATGRSGFGNNQFSGWIDYNDNGIFETAEQIFTNIPGGSANADFPIPFTIPADALNGQHLLRVRGKWASGTGDLNDPCSDLQWGSTVDFSVNIINGTLSSDDITINLADFIVVSHDDNLFEAILNTNQMIDDEVSIKVFNVLGQKIISDAIEPENGKYVYNIDMKTKSSGVYLVRVGTKTFGKVKRIVVR